LKYHFGFLLNRYDLDQFRRTILYFGNFFHTNMPIKDNLILFLSQPFQAYLGLFDGFIAFLFKGTNHTTHYHFSIKMVLETSTLGQTRKFFGLKILYCFHQAVYPGKFSNRFLNFWFATGSG
jgi:hypothetical protein